MRGDRAMTADLCPLCHGKKTVKCDNCRGSGQEEARTPIERIQGITRTCSVCGGTGLEECPICEGKGYVR